MGTIRARHQMGSLRAVMKTCATCRHHNVTKCERIVTLAIGFEDLAEVCNDDGDDKPKAWFRTSLDFGCVLHEEKAG